ncbi:hypothetical protein [Mycobacterium palustre]|uniref:hypothetical protein n=1 Tax=Mycobacterium palustre TaxID=153971 RepID=UPI00114EAA8F|nr:hypothetical protein [Mycobacterium palustre]MCV7103943.1 hypothetical protein [Mycobacterium palustre]
MGMTAGDFLCERLPAWGIDTIYGLPGDGISGMLGALRHYEDRLRSPAAARRRDPVQPPDGSADPAARHVRAGRGNDDGVHEGARRRPSGALEAASSSQRNSGRDTKDARQEADQ